MNSLIKQTFVSNFVIALTLALTASTIMLQVMQSLGELMYNVVNIFTMLGGMLILKLMAMRTYRKQLLEHVKLILILDTVFFAAICIVTLYSLELRWVLMMAIWPFFSKTGQVLMDDIINRLLKEDDLTDFKTGCQFWSTTGTLVGFSTAATLNMFDVIYPLSWAVATQLFGVIYATYIDFKWITMDVVVNATSFNQSQEIKL